MPSLQTLERGLRALEIVAEASGRLTVAQLALELGVHRTVSHRIVRTLQAAGYLHADHSNGLRLGKKIPFLYGAFSRELPPNIQPILDDLSRQTDTTTALVAQDGEECVALCVAARNEGPLQVSYRLGTRHPITKAAAGIALLGLRAPRPDEPPEVTRARQAGYAVSHGVLQYGATGIFMPVPQLGMAIGVVAMREVAPEEMLPFLREAVVRISSN